MSDHRYDGVLDGYVPAQNATTMTGATQMSDIVERLLRASPGCPCGGDPVAVRKTCPQYSRCTANADAADEIERLRTRLAEATARAEKAEARLAEAEKVVDPFAEAGKLFGPRDPEGWKWVIYGTDYVSTRELTGHHLRAARAWKEANNG